MSSGIETLSSSSEIEELENKIINDRDEEEAEEDFSELDLDIGPQLSLKDQLEKDKEDESLRRWKENLLGRIDISAIGDSKEAEVRILSITITSDGRSPIVLGIPLAKSSKGKNLFILKEGIKYRVKLTLRVSNNIVSGLTYSNTVWKTSVKVDKTKVMLGTFSPNEVPYIYELEEETVPSGILSRGSYSARTKIVDDDGKCYLDVSYNFEIQKKWPSSS